MRVHFIAIGGSAMHNLAIALKKKGYHVTGSDDEVFEPSKTRLAAHGILPEREGWFPDKLDHSIDSVILGMHARQDNPELLRAHELGLKIYSYPEFLYEQTRDKKRIVIAGSHGKTTITSMIVHVLKMEGMKFDFMVGAQLEGFDTMVSLSEDATFAVFEGDEYLASPTDRRPKFVLYQGDVGLISGIAWDHINVFPTFGSYKKQFESFTSSLSEHGVLIYCERDEQVKQVALNARKDLTKVPYGLPEYVIRNGRTILLHQGKEFPLQIFGEHNLMNLEGAKQICLQLGITEDRFYTCIASFKGASKRLELIASTESSAVYKDFAHSPSKLKATTDAVRQQFSDRKLVACMELHTFSSLNETFLKEYKGAMDAADLAYVYFNPHTIEHKKLKPVTIEQVKKAFDRQDLQVFTDSKVLVNELKSMEWKNTTLLLMTSGNFDGVDLAALGHELIEK